MSSKPTYGSLPLAGNSNGSQEVLLQRGLRARIYFQCTIIDDQTLRSPPPEAFFDSRLAPTLTPTMSQPIRMASLSWDLPPNK